MTVLLYPAYDRLRHFLGGHASLASLVMVFAVLVLVFIPMFLLGYLVLDESVNAYNNFVKTGEASGVLMTVAQSIEGYVNSKLSVGIDLTQYLNIGGHVQDVLGWVTSKIGSVFSEILKFGLSTVVFVLALFYLFRDGHKFIDHVVTISPLRDSYDRQIFEKMKQAVNSVIKGDIIIAIIQGILTGVGFVIFGLPSAALWGFIAAIFAFLPIVGTGMVIIPAIIYVFITAGWVWALGLAVYGAVVVGLIDNILRPVLIDRGMHVHPLLILFAVLGGLDIFGPIGFVVGPVILSLLFALLDIYPILCGSIKKESAR